MSIRRSDGPRTTPLRRLSSNAARESLVFSGRVESSGKSFCAGNRAPEWRRLPCARNRSGRRWTRVVEKRPRQTRRVLRVLVAFVSRAKTNAAKEKKTRLHVCESRFGGGGRTGSDVVVTVTRVNVAGPNTGDGDAADFRNGDCTTNVTCARVGRSESYVA